SGRAGPWLLEWGREEPKVGCKACRLNPRDAEPLAVRHSVAVEGVIADVRRRSLGPCRYLHSDGVTAIRNKHGVSPVGTCLGGDCVVAVADAADEDLYALNSRLR